MALGKTIIAESLDLLEAAFGEGAFVAIVHHAFDEIFLEGMDGAVPAERRHGAAQLVGLGGGEPCRDHGNLHRLFLKQRHALRSVQDFFEFRLGILDLLQSIAPTQIGMHHAALDRPRPHDRDFDDEVVIVSGLQPRQHRHLCPAFDLEHADRFTPAQHVVNGLVLVIHADRQLFAVMLVDQLEALAQGRQHAEGQHIDFVDAKDIEIVLVPFDDGAIFHRRILDRHQLVEPILGQDKTADMLRQMAGEVAQGRGQFEGQHEARVRRIEASISHVIDFDSARSHAPHRVGHHTHRIG